MADFNIKYGKNWVQNIEPLQYGMEITKSYTITKWKYWFFPTTHKLEFNKRKNEESVHVTHSIKNRVIGTHMSFEEIKAKYGIPRSVLLSRYSFNHYDMTKEVDELIKGKMPGFKVKIGFHTDVNESFFIDLRYTRISKILDLLHPTETLYFIPNVTDPNPSIFYDNKRKIKICSSYNSIKKSIYHDLYHKQK